MEDLLAGFESIGVEIALYGPRLLGVFALIGAGAALAWVLGRLAPALATRLRLGDVPGVGSFDTLLEQAGIGVSAGAVVLRAVQAGVLLVTVAQAARFAELETLGSVIARSADLIPMILIALVVLVLGIALSDRLAAIVSRLATPSGVVTPGVAATLVRVVILAVAVALALEAAGFAVDLPVVVLGIGMAATLALLVVSLAIGARGILENLLATRFVEEHYIEGQVIQFRDQEAVVTEIGMLATTIRTADDRDRTVPNAIFMREVA